MDNKNMNYKSCCNGGPNIYISTNNTDSRMGPECSSINQTNQILDRVIQTEEKTNAMATKMADIDAGWQKLQSNINEIKQGKFGELHDEMKNLREKLSVKEKADADIAKDLRAIKEKLQILEEKQESKEKSENKLNSSHFDQHREPVEHCEDYSSMPSGIPEIASRRCRSQSYDYYNSQRMMSESLQHPAMVLTVKKGRTVSNSSLIHGNADGISRILPETPTDISQTCLKEPSNYQRDSCRTQKTISNSSSTPGNADGISRTLHQTLTDFSQTHLKELSNDHTDAAETRPKVLDTTRATDSGKRAQQSTKYPPIPRKPDAIKKQLKVKQQTNYCPINDNNTAKTVNTKDSIGAFESLAEISPLTAPTNNTTRRNSTTPVHESDGTKERSGPSATELISLNIFSKSGGYFEITVRNTTTILDLESEISQEIGLALTVCYIYSKEHKNWIYSHRRNDHNFSLQKLLVKSNDVVLC